MATGKVTDAAPPDEHERATRTALDLMRMALALLDRAEDTLSAARLQPAIDTAERQH